MLAYIIVHLTNQIAVFQSGLGILANQVFLKRVENRNKLPLPHNILMMNN